MNQVNNSNKLDLLNRIYENMNSYQISNNYRDQMKITDKSYTYGEVNFEDFAKLLQKCGNVNDKIFYDLGSGSGKSCFSAVFLAGFKKAIGIEIILDFYLNCKRLKESINGEYKDLANRIQFLKGDIREANFLDGDVIFTNSTCFDDELFGALIEKFHQLKSGSYVIMTTRKMSSPNFELIYEGSDTAYSWGNPTSRIYRKK